MNLNKNVKFWLVPIGILIAIIILVMLLKSFGIIRLNSFEDYKSAFLFFLFILFLKYYSKFKKWKFFSDENRPYTKSQLEEIAKQEVFQHTFYHNKWKKLIWSIFLISIIIFVVKLLHTGYEFVLISLIIMVGYFLYGELRDLMYMKPYVKVSEKLICIRDFGYLAKDEIQEIRMRKEHSTNFPFIDRYYIDFYSKSSKSIISIYTNDIKKRKKLAEILNVKPIENQ